jgi:ABC-type transporter Mla subunit MlaD
MAEITIRISSKTIRIVGLILAAVCVVWVGQYIWIKGFLLPKYDLKMFVPEASGVFEGARVRLDGIDVGTVSAIRLAAAPADNNRRIELDLRVFKRYQKEILSDSTASLLQEGLLGNRFVNISRSFYGSPIEPGGELLVPEPTKATSNLIDLLDRIGTCMKEQKGSSPDPAKGITK